MPWHVVPNHSGCPADTPYAVVKDADGSVEGCHPSEAAANDQMAALYASEPEATVASTMFAALAVHHTATVNTAWNGGAATKAATTEAELRYMHAWRDSNGDPALKSSYKFPHHAAGTDTPANLAAVRNALARLPQADIPEGDRAGVERHLQAHLDDARGATAAAEADAVVMSIYEAAAKPSETPTADEPVTGAPSAERPIEAYSQGKWKGVLAVEGTPTGDGREFAPDALEWRDLPLSLLWQKQTAEGHDQSVIVARIDHIMRDGSLIRGDGVFDMQGIDGAESHRLIYNKFIRGLSVTLDDVKDSDIEMIWPEPEPGAEDGDNPLAELLMEPDKTIFHHARIIDTVLTSQPALQEAYIELVPDDAVTVEHPTSGPSALAASAPLAPPSEWFDNPRFMDIHPLTVDDSGRVYGHLAQWGVCHTSFAGTCVTPPHESEFSYFTTGELVTRDGERIPVGQLTLGANHAPSNLAALPAAVHYEHTGHAVADVTAGADAYGIWVAGALRPQVTDREIRTLRASALSGDWRRIGGKMRLVAALVVNVPGFPIPRTRTYTQDGEQKALVAAGVFAKRHDVVPRRVVDRIAATVGRDRAARARELRDRVHPSNGNVEV